MRAHIKHNSKFIGELVKLPVEWEIGRQFGVTAVEHFLKLGEVNLIILHIA